MTKTALALSSLVSVAALSAYWVHEPTPTGTERANSSVTRKVQPTAASSAADKPQSALQPPQVGAAAAAEPSDAGAPLRWVAIGGGATPESTEVSLEQDLALAQRVLPGAGRLLFSGGSDAACVRTLDPALEAQSVLVRLGDLYEPRVGRGSRYRKPLLTAQPTDLTRVEQTLSSALGAGDTELLVYVAAHGEQGQTARDNHVVLWSGESLTVSRVAELHSTHPRPLRMLIASCFSGGFAELAFEGAVASKGYTHAPRCGLFAGTWDRETSGCDPNPDRRAQESYSLHVLHALRAEDRHGKPLDKSQLDFDGDGVIGLLDAHTRARIASNSIDVPTTTSERFLREVQRHGAKADPSVAPEEAAVIAQLGARLDLQTHAAVTARLDALDDELEALDASLDKLEMEVERLRATLSGRLLAKWPVLDDAYHPDFHATLEQYGGEIARVLDESEDAGRYYAALAELNELDARYSDAQAQEAVVTRLLRAYETLQLSSALAKRGGKAYEDYKLLLACERRPL